MAVGTFSVIVCSPSPPRRAPSRCASVPGLSRRSEREQQPESQPNGALLPLASAITLSMLALFGALGLLAWLFSPERATQLLIIGWCAIVPFHYFVDGRIRRRRPPTPSAISSRAFPSSFSASPPL
jgi:hypothetical protein